MTGDCSQENEEHDSFMIPNNSLIIQELQHLPEPLITQLQIPTTIRVHHHHYHYRR